MIGMNESKQLNLGRAGEHLVLADLILHGCKCFMTDAGLNYDIVIDIDGKFIRLQVKTTLQPMRMNQEYITPTYLFHVRRAGKGGLRLYETTEFEGFALVALDTRQIAYIPFTKQLKCTVILRDRRKDYKVNHGHVAPYIDEFGLESFMEKLSGGKAKKI